MVGVRPVQSVVGGGNLERGKRRLQVPGVTSVAGGWPGRQGGGQGGRGHTLLFLPSLPIRAAPTPTVSDRVGSYGGQSTATIVLLCKEMQAHTHPSSPSDCWLIRTRALPVPRPARHRILSVCLLRALLTWAAPGGCPARPACSSWAALIECFRLGDEQRRIGRRLHTTWNIETVAGGEWLCVGPHSSLSAYCALYSCGRVGLQRAAWSSNPGSVRSMSCSLLP